MYLTPVFTGVGVFLSFFVFAYGSRGDCHGLGLCNDRGVTMAPMASPGEKLSAKLTDEERRYLTVLFALSLKRCYFTPFYLCISVQTVSLHVAIPHPPLRGTFPSGEGFSPGS